LHTLLADSFTLTAISFITQFELLLKLDDEITRQQYSPIIIAEYC